MSGPLTGLSRLALGTATFGVAPTTAEVDRLVGHALDHGVTLFDTASSYGNQARFDRPGVPPADQRASAEELLGRALRGRRHEVVLCTKVGERIFEGPDGRGLGRTHVRRALAQSLRRLRTDHVDVLHAHHHDPDVPVVEVVTTFGELIAEGTVRHWAISTFSGSQTREVVATADALGLPRPVLHQVRYSARQREVEDDALSVSKELGVAVTAFSALAGGLLARGTADRVHVGSARWQGPGFTDEDRAFAARFHALADARGLDPAVLALAWVLSRDGVVSAVIGPESSEELAALLPAMSLEVPSDLLAAVTA